HRARGAPAWIADAGFSGARTRPGGQRGSGGVRRVAGRARPQAPSHRSLPGQRRTGPDSPAPVSEQGGPGRTRTLSVDYRLLQPAGSPNAPDQRDHGHRYGSAARSPEGPANRVFGAEWGGKVVFAQRHRARAGPPRARGKRGQPEGPSYDDHG